LPRHTLKTSLYPLQKSRIYPIYTQRSPINTHRHIITHTYDLQLVANAPTIKTERAEQKEGKEGVKPIEDVVGEDGGGDTDGVTATGGTREENCQNAMAVLKFRLPKSSYATSALRELTKGAFREGNQKFDMA